MANRDDRARWFETAMVCLLPFLGWWYYGLFDLDEGYYGAVVAEMNRRHEWITPFFNGQPWYEKPILLYWCAKPCVMALGPMLGPRLPSVIATLATIWLLAWFSARRFSPSAGQLTALVYAGSLLPVGAGRMMLVDPLMTLCLTASIVWFWESLHERTARFRLLSGVALGFCTLAKGPVGIGLFSVIAGLCYWQLAELRPKFQGGWLGFAAGLLVTIATWYLPAYLLHREEFVQRFLIEQNVQRFLGGDSAHTVGPVGLPLYVVVLLLGMCPWSVIALRAKPWIKDRAPVERFAFLWFAAVFCFFTLAGAKLVHYVLPCCAPLALLAANSLASRWGESGSLARLPDRFWPVAGVFLAALIAHFGFSFAYAMDTREVHMVANYVKMNPAPYVVAYQMPRREKSLGTLGSKIQETSHPSLLLYLDRTISEVETQDALLSTKTPCWVITRTGRLSEADVLAAERKDMSLSQMVLPGDRLYALYLLRRKGESMAVQGQSTSERLP